MLTAAAGVGDRLRLVPDEAGTAPRQTGDRRDGLLDPLEVGVVLLVRLVLDDRSRESSTCSGASGSTRARPGSSVARTSVGSVIDAMMPPPLTLRRSLTFRPCSSARRLTTNRPIRRAVSMVTSPPLLSDSLARARASPAMPRPESMTSISTLPSSSAAWMVTGLPGGEYDSALSMSSAIRWTTSAAARPDDHLVGCRVDADPLVVLHLGDRGVDDVGDAELLEAGRATRRTAEDHQALGRPAHAGGEVVEAEQLLETLRVLFVLLQRLDERQLLVDQRGVAARQGHEHRADLGPQLGLTGRQVDRLLVHVVDRPRQLPELFLVWTSIVVSSSGSLPSRIRRTVSGSVTWATSSAPARTWRSGLIRARATTRASSSEASRAPAG